MYSQCPKFHPNRFTHGGVIAERVKTVQTRHKVFPILGEASASSPSNYVAIGQGERLTERPEKTLAPARHMCSVLLISNHSYLRPPYGIGQAIIFLPCCFFLLSSFFLSSPDVSVRGLDAYHTSTHGVALVRLGNWLWRGFEWSADRMQILPIPCTYGTLLWHPLFGFRRAMTSVV